MKPHTSNVPVLRFPEFGDEWNEFKLGDIARFRRGSFPQPYGLERWYDDEFGSPFVQVFDVGENFKLKPTTKSRISKEAQELSVFISKGSLILTLQGSIGRLAVTQYDAFVDRTLLIFESFRTDIQKYFFMYSVFLLFQKEKRTAPGGTIKTITKEVLTDFRIFLPSIAEQNQIGCFLQLIDEKIEQLTAKKGLLLKYKKGVMQQIFSRRIRFKKDNGNDFPEWEEKTLGEWGSTYNGLVGKTADDFGEGSPYVTYKQIFDNSRIQCGRFGFVRIDPKEKQNRVSFGDVFFTTSSETPSEVAFASVILAEVENLYLNSFCFGFRPHSLNTVRPQFSRYLFRSDGFRRKVFRLAQGSTRYNISKTEMMKLPIALPSPDEQMKIASFLSAIDEKIEHLDRELGETRTFKKGLLQQMFV